MQTTIDWSKQICGVHRASYNDVLTHMPDLKELLSTFPENADDFTWDVKVHMLMPAQYPCIPNWHYDNVPRINNKQDFDKVRTDLPMYLWLSGAPFTEFQDKEGGTYFAEPRKWHKFTQLDKHRGTVSNDFQWRAFIRATHKDILPANLRGDSCIRRHSQVYLDVTNFTW